MRVLPENRPKMEARRRAKMAASMAAAQRAVRGGTTRAHTLRPFEIRLTAAAKNSPLGASMTCPRHF
jgi:hypothetical protein